MVVGLVFLVFLVESNQFYDYWIRFSFQHGRKWLISTGANTQQELQKQINGKRFDFLDITVFPSKRRLRNEVMKIDVQP